MPPKQQSLNRCLARFVLRIIIPASAAFCLLFLALAVRSFFVADSFQDMWYERERLDRPHSESYLPPLIQRSWFISHGQGGLIICRDWLRTDWGGQPGLPSNTLQFYRQHDARYPLITSENRRTLESMFGFEFRASDTTNHQIRGVVLPYWSLIVATAIWPAVAATLGHLRRKRQHRAAHGLCLCGYDLRATPNRCPECGRTPSLRIT